MSAPRVYLDASTPPTAANVAGKIVPFDVPPATVLQGLFLQLALRSHEPDGQINPSAPYSRPYLAGPAALLDAKTDLGTVIR
ncbi:hypothetical protein OV208_13580 [Corallococcus sp. bb12-1]|uniref:hypothetical protein n=1 Tax=Corallococcus sp. bb12-1 TaxID=2996784 RepID=UPI00226F10E8|nr:hypothetical protein [Corallococcus sp. bb12-1]MCY1042350.1 hypothetical protein [Corallococcus sp. bb12-1]